MAQGSPAQGRINLMLRRPHTSPFTHPCGPPAPQDFPLHPSPVTHQLPLSGTWDCCPRPLPHPCSASSLLAMLLPPQATVSSLDCLRSQFWGEVLVRAWGPEA